MSFAARLHKILDLTDIISRNRSKLISLAVANLNFTVKDTAYEVDLTMEQLQRFVETRAFLENREPLGGRGSWVAVMLSYNGSAWLNTVITSTYIVGNRVRAKFSSKGAGLMGLTEDMYRSLFGPEIVFYQGSGKSFMEAALRDREVSAVVVFGTDEHILPYQDACRNAGKKLIFEGPGVDPFIVFPDAALDLALDDLMAAKFAYSGQTCTAPKRIFIHHQIYDEFLRQLVARVEKLVVGDPADARTEVSPVASSLAVQRIKMQLADAVARGAKILCGGQIRGNLVFPTVVRDATDDMLGMRRELFGPVALTSSFKSKEEVIARARNHRYGLRAAVFGGPMAREVAEALRGEHYCHPVPDYLFGKFGTVSLNETRDASWRGALVTKAIGGYGYSGWIWETINGRFQIKQGPKLISLETSLP